MHALRGVEVVELGSRVRSLTRKPLIVQSRSSEVVTCIIWHHLSSGFMSAVPRCVTLPYTVLSLCQGAERSPRSRLGATPTPQPHAP